MPQLLLLEPTRELASKSAEAGRMLGRSAYTARLAAVLGRGADWEYRGECVRLPRPDGVCSCGHQGLRLLFTLHHKTTGRTVKVGSVCITTYPGIAPELAGRLQADADRLLAEVRAAERQARQAAQAAEVQALLRQWSDAEYATDTAIDAWYFLNGWKRWLPGPIYKRPGARDRLRDQKPGELHPFVRLPALKSVAGQVKRLRRYVDECARELAAVQAA